MPPLYTAGSGLPFMPTSAAAPLIHSFGVPRSYSFAAPIVTATCAQAFVGRSPWKPQALGFSGMLTPNVKPARSEPSAEIVGCR